MRDGYVVATMNFSSGSRRYIGQIFTSQVISGFQANPKLAWTFLLSCPVTVGVFVLLTPRKNCCNDMLLLITLITIRAHRGIMHYGWMTWCRCWCWHLWFGVF